MKPQARAALKAWASVMVKLRYTMTRPCAHCPFRTSPRFAGLHPERVAEMIRPDLNFQCHETIDYRGDRAHTMTKRRQHCAGKLIMLRKEGKSPDHLQLIERFGLYDPERLDLSAPVFKSGRAMLAAMKRAWNKGFRRVPKLSGHA